MTDAPDLLLLDVPEAARAAYARLLGRPPAAAADPLAAETITVGAVTVTLGLPQWCTAPGVLLGADDVEAETTLARRRGLDLSQESAALAVDGLTWGFAAGERGAPSTSEVTGLDHVVLGSPNRDRILAALCGRLGFDLRLDRVQSWGVHQLYLKRRGLLVEVVLDEAENADPAGPDTMYGLAWRSPDLECTVARLAAAGVPTSDIRRGAKPGTRVATVRDRELGLPTIVIEQG